MKYNNYIGHIAVVCWMLLFVSSCSGEWSESSIGNLNPGDVALQWVPANMAIHQVNTRGTDPKTAAEQQINNIHVFVFDKDGNYLTAQGNDAFQGYRYQEGNSTMVFNRDMFNQSTQDPSLAKVFVLANMPKTTFTDGNNDGRPDEIDNMSALQSFVFNLPVFSATLPEDGLPMVAWNDVDLSPNPEGSTSVRVHTIQLKSLMARIDLNFTLEPAQTSGSKLYPSLRFDRIGVGNFPSGGTVAPQLEDENVKETDDKKQGMELKSADIEGVSDFTGHYIREGEPQILTLYMFEHARLAKELSEVFPETGNYPANISEADKQRYKNWLAKEDAAYIELEGIYTNHNNYMYKVTYRLYPGADAIDDFTIKNNCQYKNNITVSGITVNNQGSEALLDTRVNIDTQANPYFIEMLREREHDAHFCVTPMDIYIYEGGSVTVEIENPDNNKWIRMEPINRAAQFAGDGKRDYFTVDLLDDLDKKSNSKFCTVTYHQEHSGTYEERIYFYIDENVPQEGITEDGDDVPAREAKLRITYTRPGGEEGTQEYSREIPIQQAGMKAVYFTKFSEGQYNRDRQKYYFYIENYEEYLEHYDGKDQYDDVQEGLSWGLRGVQTGLGAQYEFCDYMSWGWKNTMKIMQKYRKTESYEGELTLNDTPSGAAEYCYNKNKRDTNGKVVEARWYLPTISELEYALEKYYGVYDVFQDKWYWSSNPGAAGSSGDKGENTQYARATRIKYDPSDKEAIDGYVHYPSDPDKPYSDGLGGFAKRNEAFRIRAAYIYQVPKDGGSVKESY